MLNNYCIQCKDFNHTMAHKSLCVFHFWMATFVNKDIFVTTFLEKWINYGDSIDFRCKINDQSLFKLLGNQ